MDIGPLELQEIIEKVMAREVIVNSLRKVKDIFKNSRYKLLKSDSKLKKSLEEQIKEVFNWALYVQQIIPSEVKLTHTTYINLDYYLTPRSYQIDELTRKNVLIENVFNSTLNHIAILGDPGAGKTTSMKMLVIKCLTEEAFLPAYAIPIVVKFRKLDFKFSGSPSKTKLLDHISSILDFEIEFKEKSDEIEFGEVNKKYRNRALIKYLDSLNSIIILDGFDEIPFYNQQLIISEISYLVENLKTSRLILTSRIGSLKFILPKLRQYFIAPLTKPQIKEFVTKYLGEKSEAFLTQIENSLYKDTVIKPVILSFLITVYEVNGFLPDQPYSLYEQIVDILIYKWDRIRNIPRENKVQGFEYNIKRRFLQNLSYSLEVESLNRFSKSQFTRIFKSINLAFPQLKTTSVDLILEEIEEHTGILVEFGYNQYEYPHRSIQEFLAAEYVSSYQPITDLNDQIIELPQIIATASIISSNVSSFFVYYVNLVINSKTKTDTEKLLYTYVNRIMIENVFFIPSPKVGYALSLLLDSYLGEDSDLSSLLLSLINIGGAKVSLQLLETLYKLDPSDYEKARSTNQDLSKTIVRIQRREYRNKEMTFRLNIPIVVVKDWKYVKSIINWH